MPANQQNWEFHDVGIVLGGGCKSNTELSKSSIARLETAMQLVRDGAMSKLILSGGISFSAPPELQRTEASLMQEYLLARGFAESDVLLEQESKDTLGNAYFCRVRYLEPRNWHLVLVVTSDFHVNRASYLFKKVLGEAFRADFASCPTGLAPEQMRRLEAREKRIKEVYDRWLYKIPDGDVVAIEDVLFQRHPGYSKTPEMSREEFIRLLYGDL